MSDYFTIAVTVLILATLSGVAGRLRQPLLFLIGLVINVVILTSWEPWSMPVFSWTVVLMALAYWVGVLNSLAVEPKKS